MDQFKILRAEITLDILTRLPTESVFDCKLVCTDWRNLISHHPSFSKMHLHHLNHHFTADDSGKLDFIVVTKDRSYFGDHENLQYFEIHESTTPTIQRISRVNFTQPFEHFKIVGSCDGLICLIRLYRSATQPVCICNPVTRQYVVLPEIDCDTDDDDVNWTFGFGYVSSTNEYKVVAIHWLNKEFIQAQIYTLGSGNGWKNLGNFSSQFTGDWICILCVQAIFADGALYWLDIVSNMVVSFNLADEKFCAHLSPPPLPPDNDFWYNRLGVLGGFLYFAVPQVVEEAICYDIWLLKKKNGNQDMEEQLEEHQSLGWNKKFRINEIDLFAVTKSDSVLTYYDNYLRIYDTKSSTSKSLVDFKEQISIVFPYKSTLVSLNELGEEHTKRMESIEIEETWKAIISLQL
ncbi:F-box/kelch-repeat protein At3g23880-like [Papaver somniferum]|uniref:F-box/kelch-repeat protein At3g23880-like n=1 Tax=Papaver somniferum TaxID=3469 RepID=UPI000E70559C|nr:F-box/kelch-repeat protein At3g23880-like [Papaver somniferum]